MRAPRDRRSASLSLALLLWLNASASMAQTALQDGIKLYNAKQYRQSLGRLSTALAESNSPTVLYYAALCYSQLGDKEHAKQYYELLRSNFPGSPESELAKEGLRLLEAPPPTVNVTAPPSASSAASDKVPPALPSAEASNTDVSKFVADYPMSDAEWKSLPGEAKIPFQRGTSSHLFVNGTVNGRPMRMMFDTGASTCVFYKKDIEAAGVKVDSKGPKLKIGGVGGSTTSQVMMADLEIGSIKRHIPIVVSDTPFGFSLVGQTFFKEFKYNIDNGSGFIQLIKKPRPTLGAAGRVFESTDVVKVPFENVGSNMQVNVKINGKSVPMIFDTGAYAVTMPLLLAPSLGLNLTNAERVMSYGVGGGVGGFKVYADRIELGPIVKTHVPIILNNSLTPSLLGQPFFADRKFTIDNENHTINFVH